MKAPDDVRALLKRRFASKRRQWLRQEADSDGWPLDLSLSTPSEGEAHENVERVRAWALAWKSWTGPGHVIWTHRRWRDLGVQALPERLVLANASEVASWAGETERWSRACARYNELIGRWPILSQTLPQHFDVLADYSEPDYRRLADMLGWLSANPSSGLYPRQLPIAGMDSKWIEGRKGLITTLVRAQRQVPITGADFFEVCGLRPLPSVARIRVLDPLLRVRVNGLSDILARPEELAHAGIAPNRVFIVENLQTGLSLPDIQGAVAFMGLGYGIDALAPINWIREAQCFYWGDIDTHGLAILSRMRAYLPSVNSFLMDADTLVAHKPLWSVEPTQHSAPSLLNLRPEEADLYIAMKGHRWGDRIRLEQERISWNYVLDRISTEFAS